MSAPLVAACMLNQGVGNSQWHTYQQFPREVDAGLHSCGAARICGLGACDVDSSSFDSDFDDWLATLLQRIGGASAAADAAAEDQPGRDEFVLQEGSADEISVNVDVKTALAAINQAMRTASQLLGDPDAPPSRNLPLEVPCMQFCSAPLCDGLFSSCKHQPCDNASDSLFTSRRTCDLTGRPA